MVRYPNSSACNSHFLRRLALALTALAIALNHGCSNSSPQHADTPGTHATDSTKPAFTPPQKITKPQPANLANHSSNTPPTPPPIHFQTLPPESGFNFTRFDDQQGQRRILEANGGGVAILDLDLDAWPDVFLTNGCRIPIANDDLNTPGKLFRNRSQLRFNDVSNPSGLTQFGLGFGCAVADADEDGFDDLYITRYAGNQFWHNNGDGTFTEIASQNGSLSGDWGSSAAFADLNRDGWQDLYVVNYLKESDSKPRLCPDPASPTGFIGCSPALFPGVSDRVFLSTGDGSYIDASASAGLHQFPGKGLGVVISDLDGDFLPEIYVANDGEANFLFSIEVLPPTADSLIPQIRLHDHALEANAALNEVGYAQASMGIATGDLDHNGRTDLFLTHFYGDTNTLYLNHSSPGQLNFQDATRASALGPPSRLKLGFGTLAEDFNGDGWDDIFVANGHVDDRTWMQGGQPFQMQAQVFANHQSRFTDVSSSAGDWFNMAWLGRGAATADFNRDGLPDIAVSSQLAPATILINDSPPNSSEYPSISPRNSANIRPIGTNSCRTPWGLILADESSNSVAGLLPGESFQSASDRSLCLPTSTRSAITKIRWPSTTEQAIKIPPGEFLLLEKHGLLSLVH